MSLDACTVEFRIIGPTIVQRSIRFCECRLPLAHNHATIEELSAKSINLFSHRSSISDWQVSLVRINADLNVQSTNNQQLLQAGIEN